MKIVFTTGGTGGHIYPAIALAKALQADSPDHKILFIGTNNHMENDIVRKANFKFFGYRLNSGLGNMLNKILQYIQLLKSIVMCYVKFLFDRPDMVIAFGSYVTVPPLVAARFLNIPYILHEQNSTLGKANQTFFKHAQRVIVCYKSLKQSLNSDKVVYIGNPRSSEVQTIEVNRNILTQYDLKPNIRTLLIVMGSQGSQSVNDTMFEMLPELSKQRYQIIYVTGREHYDYYKDLVKSDNLAIVPYIDQPQFLRNVDLVIARGGATTASEICSLGTPSILIPSPYVADDHQFVNAMELGKVNAAVVIREEEMTKDLLMQTINDIIYSDEKLLKMRIAALSLSTPNAIRDSIKLMKGVYNNNDSETK